MATVAECEAALRALAARLSSVSKEDRERHVLDRTLACEVSDLGTSFSGRLSDDGLTGITQGAVGDAQIRLKVSSDDLIALTEGRLNLATAWATGRVKIDASITDMLRLRALL